MLLLLLTAFIAAQTQANSAPTDQAAVDRGQQLMTSQCGFCHGSNARGGSGGPDLTRSEIVQTDENGKQLGDFLKVGRPDKGMPKFELTEAQNSDLAAFLHAAIYLNSNRRLYKIQNILVGDPKAGETFFKGAGRCTSCHSTTNDLKSIGTRYTDPVTLQQRMVLPRNPAPGAPPLPPYRAPNAIKVTVAPSSGEAVTGALIRLTDFDVTLYEPKSGQIRSWLRNGDSPKVTVTDPLQGHVEMLTKWTDADMHNVTAYLAGVK
jgi:mono/diheme cytochrome c family protein